MFNLSILCDLCSKPTSACFYRLWAHCDESRRRTLLLWMPLRFHGKVSLTAAAASAASPNSVCATLIHSSIFIGHWLKKGLSGYRSQLHQGCCGPYLGTPLPPILSLSLSWSISLFNLASEVVSELLNSSWKLNSRGWYCSIPLKMICREKSKAETMWFYCWFWYK